MRRALLTAFVAIVGCGKPAPAPVALPAPVASQEDGGAAEAAFGFDAACASIESAAAAAKRLVPGSDGEAKEALLSLAAMLDAAGESLADHTQSPVGDKAVEDASDALQALRDARDVLEGLAPDAPKAYDKILSAARADVEEAIDAVDGGIKRLGGKVPAESGRDSPESRH